MSLPRRLAVESVVPVLQPAAAREQLAVERGFDVGLAGIQIHLGDAIGERLGKVHIGREAGAVRHQPGRGCLPQRDSSRVARQRAEVRVDHDGHAAVERRRPDVRRLLERREPLRPDGRARVAADGRRRGRVVEAGSLVVEVVDDERGLRLGVRAATASTAARPRARTALPLRRLIARPRPAPISGASTQTCLNVPSGCRSSARTCLPLPRMSIRVPPPGIATGGGNGRRARGNAGGRDDGGGDRPRRDSAPARPKPAAFQAPSREGDRRIRAPTSAPRGPRRAGPDAHTPANWKPDPPVPT